MSQLNSIRLELPSPVSSNRYWRVWGGRAVLSTEARSYKIACQIIAAREKIKPITGAVSVSITLHPKLTKKGVASKTRLDLDNCLKVALDALQGVAFSNDKQVVKLLAELGPAQVGGALMVEVEAA